MTELNVYQQARLTRDRRFDGQFFVAVKTTNIFCRPICPANLPLEKNVEYFTLAQQAMNHGYRPCLRCHPDSAPKSNTWLGVNTTVKRACKLLQTHRDLNIADIANKLGISERYFRQLFKKQLGLSPKQFQLFDQILFAKHLLHHSNLPIEHIAQACGFASARRLQFQIKRLTGICPSQIRQKKITFQQEVKLTMAFRPPYNWPKIRDFLSIRAIPGVEIVADDSYSRTFFFDEAKGYFTAQFSPLNHVFNLSIKLDNMELLPAILQNIERLLDVSADTTSIAKHLMNSGIPKEKIIEGLRLPGIWDTFEAGCRAILGQQISVKAAINLCSTLVENVGELFDGKRYFPKPEAVCKDALLFLRIPEKRRKTLIDFAQWYVNHSRTELDECLAIKGIGPWTISYAKLRGLSAPDIWLDSDLVIKNQLTHYAIDPELARPWRSYLTLQLWNLA